jgi:hypothetical protein
MVSGSTPPGRVIVTHADAPAAQEFCSIAEKRNHVRIEAAAMGQIIEI